MTDSGFVQQELSCTDCYFKAAETQKVIQNPGAALKSTGLTRYISDVDTKGIATSAAGLKNTFFLHFKHQYLVIIHLNVTRK